MNDWLTAMHQDSLVRSSDASQLVNKNRSCALSIEWSLFTYLMNVISTLAFDVGINDSNHL